MNKILSTNLNLTNTGNDFKLPDCFYGILISKGDELIMGTPLLCISENPPIPDNSILDDATLTDVVYELCGIVTDGSTLEIIDLEDYCMYRYTFVGDGAYIENGQVQFQELGELYIRNGASR